MESAQVFSARVLVKYRLKRLLNLARVGFKRGAKASTIRTATGKKGMSGIIRSIFLSSVLIISFSFQFTLIISKTSSILGNTEITKDSALIYPAYGCEKIWPLKKQENPDVLCEPLSENTGRLAPKLVSAFSLEILLLLLSIFFINIASKEISGSEWDLEWLATMPVSVPKLMNMRILERTIVNPTAILVIWPFLSILLLQQNVAKLAAVVFGFILAIPILYFEAAFRTIVDTGLKLVISSSQLRNMQAILSLFGALSILSVVSINKQIHPFLFHWISVAPTDWLRFTPIGLIIDIAGSQTIAPIFMNAMLLTLELGVAHFLILFTLSLLLKDGVIAGGTREGNKRKIEVISSSFQEASKKQKSFFSPIQIREFKLLARDRNFLMQAFLLPALITLMQFYLASDGPANPAIATKDRFTILAASAFGAAAYALIFSAFQVLSSEGKSLWILYTLPLKLEDAIRQKVMLWIGIALIYPVAIFASGIGSSGWLSGRHLLLMPIVIFGVFVYGNIAACFGIFASDPLSEEPTRKNRPDYTLLYMYLAGLYTYAIFAESIWNKCVLLILSTLMSLALFQKARDHIPYLLDPTEMPKQKVSLSDGLIAAMMFFVLQGIAAFLFMEKDKTFSIFTLFIAFSIAGAMTFGSLRFIYWFKKTEDIPKIFGPGLFQAIGAGFGGGVIAGGIGILYLKLIQHFGFFAESFEKAPHLTDKEKIFFAGIAILAAPLFEEFIFRGIIFRGLLRSWNLSISILLSASIFSIIHPPTSVIPVFFMAMIAAFTYSRTRLLITPIFVHVVYNLVVFIIQR